jgi:hypothetical protein
MEHDLFGKPASTFPHHALVERDADAFFPAPDDVARPSQLLGWHRQGKAVGDEQWRHDFERRPGLGKIANGAVDRAAAELDRAGLQYAVSRCDTTTVHRTEIPLIAGQFHKNQYAAVLPVKVDRLSACSQVSGSKGGALSAGFGRMIGSMDAEGGSMFAARSPDHDAIKWNRIMISSLCVSMILIQRVLKTIADAAGGDGAVGARFQPRRRAGGECE